MQNGKIKIYWARQDTGDLRGNILGYAFHNKMMKQYCEKYFEYTDDADIVISINPADHFRYLPGKINVLFSMWECLDVPQTYIPPLKKADLIIVPSTFCKDIFKKITDRPIEVCREGVDPEKFKFYKRRFPDFKKGEKFRFLWLGAPNPRKGYYTILEAIKLVKDIPEWEMYIKTTAHKKLTLKEFLLLNLKRIKGLFTGKIDGKKNSRKGIILQMINSFKRFMSKDISNTVQILGKYNNIIFDTRKLPQEDLIALYNSAHCFLSPHTGEGFGLPMCEALATGCPVIATGASGCADFFNEDVGYPVRYDIKKCNLQNYDLKARVFIPDTDDFVNKMIYVYKNYNEALKKAEKGSYRIHKKFTWEKSAQRLNEIIRRYYANSN